MRHGKSLGDVRVLETERKAIAAGWIKHEAESAGDATYWYRLEWKEGPDWPYVPWIDSAEEALAFDAQMAGTRY